jgi:ribA/ribD-fused uncharacterized protein
MAQTNTTIGRFLQSLEADKDTIDRAYSFSKTIDSFEGSYEFLSNFYEAPVKWQGITYPTSEHAFQAAKVINPVTRMQIAAAPTPGKAKRMGRKVELRADWEQVKENIMYEIIKSKFTQNTYCLLALLATGDADLVEGNDWHDNEWGDCDCPNCQNIEGKNKLGKILMRVREELREELRNHG